MSPSLDFKAINEQIKISSNAEELKYSFSWSIFDTLENIILQMVKEEDISGPIKQKIEILIASMDQTKRSYFDFIDCAENNALRAASDGGADLHEDDDDLAACP